MKSLKNRMSGFVLLLTCILLHTSFAPHPVHVTEAEAHWKKNQKRLEISVKLFYNDLEYSLSELHSEPIYLCPDSNNRHRAYVKQYFKNNFKLAVNNSKKSFDFLGYECEEEVIYVYLEYKGVKKLKSVELESTLLFDYFSDQTNLLHLHANGTTHTLLTKPTSKKAGLDL